MSNNTSNNTSRWQRWITFTFAYYLDCAQQGVIITLKLPTVKTAAIAAYAIKKDVLPEYRSETWNTGLHLLLLDRKDFAQNVFSGGKQNKTVPNNNRCRPIPCGTRRLGVCLSRFRFPCHLLLLQKCLVSRAWQLVDRKTSHLIPGETIWTGCSELQCSSLLHNDYPWSRSAINFKPVNHCCTICHRKDTKHYPKSVTVKHVRGA